MNGPGDIPATNGTVPEQPCSLTALLPSFGMSCRGRAEAFARRLQSRLRTLGSQTEDSPTTDEDPIIVSTENTWLTQDDHQQVVTSLQPLRHISSEADAFFDFDCEPESPGSPAEECEYSRLIETASTTPQNDCAPESGYICASPITPENGSHTSNSSSDEPYFDPEASENEQRSLPSDYYDCIELKRDSGITVIVNGHHDGDDDVEDEREQVRNIHNDSSDSLSESLPPSQDSTSTNAMSTTQSSFTFTGATSASNSTLQDIILSELHQQSTEYKTRLYNGHSEDCVENVECAENGSTETQHDDRAQNLINILEDESDKALEEEEHIREQEHQKEQPQEIRSATEILTNGFNGVEHSIPKNIVITDNSISIELIKSTNQSQEQDQEQKDFGLQKQDQMQGNTSEENATAERSHLSACDTDDDDDCRPQRVRRCSSLKTGKTPPGTPGRKKIVRFADVLGLDLADVKTFMDEIPTIPKSAYEDLDVVDTLEQPMQLGPRVDKILMPLFQQPGGLPNFLDIVRDKQVSLENAAVTDTINLTITGSVRVRNLDFNKSVHIRYSLDNWRSYADLQANYAQNSCDGFSDKFTFVLFGNSLNVGQRLEFAVRFQCKGQQFWDSNYGTNYCFQCLPLTTAITSHRPIIPHHHASAILSPSDTWCGGSFY